LNKEFKIIFSHLLFFGFGIKANKICNTWTEIHTVL